MKKIIILALVVISIFTPLVYAKQEDSGSNGVPFQALWDALDAINAAISDLQSRVSALEATHSLSEVWSAIWGVESEVETLQNEVNVLKEEVMELKKNHPLVIGAIFIRPSDVIQIPSGTPYTPDVYISEPYLTYAIESGACFTYTWDGVTSDPIPLVSMDLGITVTPIRPGTLPKNYVLTITIPEFWCNGQYVPEAKDSITVATLMPNTPPEITLTWSPEQPHKDERIIFSLYVWDASGRDRVQSYIDFGNGDYPRYFSTVTASGIVQADYTFQEAGEYTLTVTAEDQWGAATEETYPITIN